MVEATFLQRYVAGEYEQVWAELVALGDAVREEPLYADALAVARETMRRVRQNIEMLIPRLIAVGYQFGYGWIQPFVRERLMQPYRANYDPATGKSATGILLQPTISERYSIGYRLAYEEYLDLASSAGALFIPANDNEERIAVLEENIARTSPAQERLREQSREMQAELRTKPSAEALVAELEEVVGLIPLSVRAWYEVVGSVNFVGDHAGWRALLPESVTDFPVNAYDYLNPMHVLDPFWIWPLEKERLALYRRLANEGRVSAFVFAEAGRGLYLDAHRSLCSYAVRVPNAAMDAPFVHRCPYQGMSFVAYLRECFRWGGFPGWGKLEKRPEEDITFLTRDLLPI